MKIAIDLLWVKPKKSGGIESYIRNLLDGFLELENKNEYILILAKDNSETFNKYFKDSRFNKIICNIESSKVAKRIIWQNLMLNNILKKCKAEICFEPIYSKPFITSKSIKFITTIHDLQALHYPQYFSKVKYYWLKYSWKRALKTSDKIIAISNFVKKDIVDKYDIQPNKIKVIYNPIVISNEVVDFGELEKKFAIEKNEYYYTVAQLLPHKNLETIIKAIKKLNDKKIELPKKLLISGINGKSTTDLINIIKEYNIEDKIILTGYVENSERNMLYKNCRAFLFPSVFEGFGMPPIEAMMLGGKVVCTKYTSLYEVTQGKANYVDDPYNVNEWINVINSSEHIQIKDMNFNVYDRFVIAKKYLELFNDAVVGK